MSQLDQFWVSHRRQSYALWASQCPNLIGFQNLKARKLKIDQVGTLARPKCVTVADGKPEIDQVGTFT